MKYNCKKGATFLSRTALAAVMIPLTFQPYAANAAVSIIISATVDLNFGSITEDGAGGTVQVLTSGGRVAGGGVTAVTGLGLNSNGVLLIAGSTGLAIDLSMGATSYMVNNGGANMLVDNFNLVTTAGGSSRSIVLGSNPSSFAIGATLHVGAMQAAGTYTGTYFVNANYQ